MLPSFVRQPNLLYVHSDTSTTQVFCILCKERTRVLPGLAAADECFQEGITRRLVEF